MNKSKTCCYCIIGRTGSGKSSITRKVADDMGLKILQSYTTRSPRKGEIDNPNVDHLFITSDEADLMLKEEVICAYTEINHNRYFATLEQLMISKFYVIDPLGYVNLQNELNKLRLTDIELIPIYITTPYEIRKERYMQRNQCTEDDFDTRNSSESEQFAEFEKCYRDDVIYNDGDFDKAVDKMKEIVGGD